MYSLIIFLCRITFSKSIEYIPRYHYYCVEVQINASVNDVKRSIFLNIGYSFSINHYFCFKNKPFSLVMPKFRISNIHMATESIIINRNETFKAGAIVLDSKSTFSANWRLCAPLTPLLKRVVQSLQLPVCKALCNILICVLKAWGYLSPLDLFDRVLCHSFTEHCGKSYWDPW